MTNMWQLTAAQRALLLGPPKRQPKRISLSEMQAWTDKHLGLPERVLPAGGEGQEEREPADEGASVVENENFGLTTRAPTQPEAGLNSGE